MNDRLLEIERLTSEVQRLTAENAEQLEGAGQGDDGRARAEGREHRAASTHSVTLDDWLTSQGTGAGAGGTAAGLFHVTSRGARNATNTPFAAISLANSFCPPNVGT
jgi:hypothetical protein